MKKLMPGITTVVLGLFVAYAAAWFFNVVDSNFSILLFIATLITGVYWLLEKFVFMPERVNAAASLEQQAAARQQELSNMGITQTETHRQEMLAAKDAVLHQPWWMDWTAGLFPVICIVFLLRSFLFEPFKIPTGSMIPTLLVGDLILVNKYTYGVRLPVINKKIIEVNKPARGDVMVFRYPPNPNVDYIKRVIGVPGDEVSYLNKKLMINGKPLSKDEKEMFIDKSVSAMFKQYEESLPISAGVESADALGKALGASAVVVTNGERKHRILNDDTRPAMIQGVEDFPFRQNCRYSVEGVVCKVPEGHYFMMGDNRDNSLDSRYWGFVPEQNIVGKAFFVWMNFGNLSRIGSFN